MLKTDESLLILLLIAAPISQYLRCDLHADEKTDSLRSSTSVFYIKNNGDLALKPKIIEKDSAILYRRILDSKEGAGISEDDLKKLNNLAEQGDVDALNLFAWNSLKFRTNDAKKVLNLLEKHVEENSISAYLLGCIYDEQFGVISDPEIRSACYRTAYKLDNENLMAGARYACALNETSNIKAFRSPSADEAHAILITITARKENDVPAGALVTLAAYKRYGFGCEKNIVESDALLEKAVNLNDPEALYHKGMQIYYAGESRERALRFITRSADAKYMPAKAGLAEIYDTMGYPEKAEQIRIEALINFQSEALGQQGVVCLRFKKIKEAAILFMMSPDLRSKQQLKTMMNSGEISREELRELFKEVLKIIEKGSFRYDLQRFLCYQKDKNINKAKASATQLTTKRGTEPTTR